MTPLRDEFERISDSAPDVRIAGDTWTRARRANRQVRLTIAAATVLLVSGGLAFSSVDTGSEGVIPAGTQTQLRVPDDVFAVPLRLMTDVSNEDSRTQIWSGQLKDTSDLRVGRAAVAFLVGEGGRLPVVVSAEDGVYRPLTLPGFSGGTTTNVMLRGGEPLALAPDGRSLAYAWWDPAAPLDTPMPAGIKVLDLESGDVQTIALERGNGVNVGRITWSPDSEWLAWVGDETKSWTPGNISGGDTIAGRIRLAEGISERAPFPKRRGPLSVAISNTGEMAWEQGEGVVAWDATGTKSQLTIKNDDLPNNGYSVGAFSPSGDRLALEPQFGPGLAIREDDGVITSNVEATPGFESEESTRVLGWVDEQHVVLLHRSVSEEGWIGDTQLVLASPGSPTDLLVVGWADSVNFSSLSVAVDLMSLETPTVPAVEPAWPWSSERKWIVFGIPGFLGLVLALWWWGGARGRSRFFGERQETGVPGSPGEPTTPG